MISVRGGRAEGDDEQERDDHEGQREHGLHEPPDDQVEGAAEVAHGQAEGGAEDGAEDGGQRGDDQDVPGADDDPGQHVPAELVGAEPVRPRRAGVVGQQLLRERVVRRDQVPEDRRRPPRTATMPAPTRNVGLRSSSRHRAGVARLARRHRDRSGRPEYRPVRSSGATGSTVPATPARRGCQLIASPPIRSRGLSAISSRSAASVAST